MVCEFSPAFPFAKKGVGMEVKQSRLDSVAILVTKAMGSTVSIIIHTILFVGIFVLALFGIPLESIMLILTTVVSLEAIYLSLLIQMTVNRNTASLEAVEEDIDKIEEDIDEIQEDVEEIEDDVEEISKDLVLEGDLLDSSHSLVNIEKRLQLIMDDIQKLKSETT